jgi:hypothetical protein
MKHSVFVHSFDRVALKGRMHNAGDGNIMVCLDWAMH